MRVRRDHFLLFKFDWVQERVGQGADLACLVELWEIVPFESLRFDLNNQGKEGSRFNLDLLKDELSLILRDLFLLHFFILLPGYRLDQRRCLLPQIPIKGLRYRFNPKLILSLPFLNPSQHFRGNRRWLLIEILLINGLINELWHTVHHSVVQLL